MILDPSEYASRSATELLEAAAMGYVRVDRRLLHALLDQNPNAGEIVEFAEMHADHAEHRVDLEDNLVDIFRHLKTRESLPFLLAIVERDPQNIPDAVVEALRELGDAVVDPLLELSREASEEDRPEFLFLLAALPSKDPRILRAVASLWDQDPDDTVLCLGLHGDPAAIPLLQQFRERADLAVQSEIDQAIESLRGEPAVEDDPEPIWSLYPEEAGPLFEILDEEEILTFFDSPLAEYRMRAAQSLAYQDLTTSAKEKLLAVANSDSDPMVRARAWEALGTEVEDPAILEAMAMRFQSGETPLEERAALVIALAPSGALEVRDWIDRLYAVPETRAAALQAMWRSGDKEYGRYVAADLSHADPGVRRQAILALGYLELSDLAELLLPLFNDPEMRDDALYAYALAGPVELTEPSLVALLETIDQQARGLDEEELHLVQSALDERLMAHDQAPVFGTFEDEDEDEDHSAHGHTH